MFTLDGSDGRFLRVSARGILDSGDYSRFEVAFDAELAQRHVPFPLLLDLEGFRGWTARGFIRDLQFDVRHRNTFSRIAVVGDRQWHKWSTYAAAPLFRARLRYFWPKDAALAEAWLSERG